MGCRLVTWLYALLVVSLTLATTTVLLVLARCILLPVTIWLLPSFHTVAYDLGLYGAYPSQSYVSFDLSSPKPNLVRWHRSCDNGYVFLDVNGPSVTRNSPTILDSNGELVWMSNKYDTTMNLRLQTYKSQPYLTFWTGAKAKSSGRGVYYMLDSSYRLAHTVRAVGDGLSGDLHEFKITSDDTALITVYNLTTADLTALGMFHSTQDWIVDSMFQELDIATGEIIFQWRASDHFNVTNSFMWHPLAGYCPSLPYDFFHLNSVEKDSRGNFLVSSRHFHSVMYIDGKTGDVRWVLGGALDDFEHIGDVDFKWQHDARWLSEDDGLLSLFDNGLAWPQNDAPYSEGHVIQLDVENRIAETLRSYASLQHARSSSQGSLQLVPASDQGQQHIFIGWGSSALTTESTMDGAVLCEMHFGASYLHFWERVKSYRAFKAPRIDWDAQPADWPPSIKLQGDEAFVSWNGATRVASWMLEGARSENTQDLTFEPIDVMEKHHFEERFILPSRHGGLAYTRFRVAALDGNGEVLAYSDPVQGPLSSFRTYVWFGCLFMLIVCTTGGIWFVQRHELSFWHGAISAMDKFDRNKYQKMT